MANQTFKFAGLVSHKTGVTKALFGADSDFTSIAKVYEQWAGVEMRG